MLSQLLLIEDTPSLQMVYKAILEKAGYNVIVAGTAAEGLRLFTSHKPKLVLLDLMLPDRDGLSLMKDMLALNPDTRVIVITANGSINKAITAIRDGAFEFLVKPFDELRLISTIQTAISSLGGLDVKSDADQKTIGEYLGFIGSSPKMQEIYLKINAISRSMATVFITGESGTGKEVCAQAVHFASNRAQAPFVPLNCGAIPHELLESEVFGHLKGSFTGAIADKIGAAEAADGGTLFLDEICELDMSLQTKLLRFLQTSTIQPVGAVSAHKVNVRIICATNRDPLEEVRKGNFREDLYYRLHVVPVHLPPLRTRGEDVIEIAEAMVLRYSQEEGKKFESLDQDVKDLFRRLSWPGNVRQVLNVLRNVVVLNDGVQIRREMLPLEILNNARVGTTEASQPDPVGQNTVLNRTETKGLTLAEIERIAIENCIARYDGSVTLASRELDVSPSTIYRKLDQWRKN